MDEEYVADDTDAWWGMLDNPETLSSIGSLGNFSPEELKNYGFEVIGDQTGTGGYGITDDDGNTLVVTADGQKYLTDASGKTISPSDAKYKTVAPGLFDKFTKALSTPAGLAAAGTAIYGLLGGGNQPELAGYKGSIPKLTAVREQIKQPDYVPYSGQAVMGRRFFTPTEYVAPGDAEATRQAARETAQGIQQVAAPPAATAPNAPGKTAPSARGIYDDFIKSQTPAQIPKELEDTFPSGKQIAGPVKSLEEVLRSLGRPLSGAKQSTGIMAPGPGDTPADFGPMPEAAKRFREEELIYALGQPGAKASGNPPVMGPQKPNYSGPEMPPSITQPAITPGSRDSFDYDSYAAAAKQTAAQGGIMGLGRYLRGGTDGMADKIPSSIDGVQPAALSHGEFVIPADVVSHLGNGNSDAGANQLYKMMDRVRKDRTGTTKQGKKINPDKYLGGGIANYASGGIAHFQTGGTSSASALAPSSTNPFGSTAQTSIAPYVGDYVTNMLGRGQALAGEGYQAYQGPLTAGYSPLQQQAFTAAGNINPQATFGTQDLQNYMNPYTQLSLQPQLDELRRQAQISQANLQGQFSKAGAFGGAREAIARSENLRNLQTAQSGLIGKGFENAFNQAMNQYNVGRQQQLSDLGALAGLGAQQRGIEQEGITALQKQFEQERMDPYTKLQFQQGLLQGLPIGTTSITPNLTDIGKAGISLDQARKVYDVLKGIPGFSESISG